MLSRGGVESVITNPDGTIRSASAGFAARAVGDPTATLAGQDFVSLLRTDDRERLFFAREGRGDSPVDLERRQRQVRDAAQKELERRLPGPTKIAARHLLGLVQRFTRLRERLRIDAHAILDNSLDVRTLLVQLLDDDEATLVEIDAPAQPGDRLRLRLGALDLDRPVKIEVAVRGVVLRDNTRRVRIRLFDEPGRQRVERLLATPDLVSGHG